MFWNFLFVCLFQRVRLLRFLCDQALDTRKIRIHMEETMDVALEHQSKLRHLLAERRRNAELDEFRLEHSKEARNAFAVLQAGSAKMKRHYPAEHGHHTPTVTDIDPSQKPSSEVVGIIDREQRTTGFLGPEQQQHLHHPAVGSTITREFQDPFHHNSGFDPMDIINSAPDPRPRDRFDGSAENPIQILDDSVRPPDPCTPMNNNNAQRGGGGGDQNSSSGVKEEIGTDPLALKTNSQLGLEAEVVGGGKVSLPRGLTSPLDAEIAKALAKLMGVNIRRDLLGRDDHGRGYWALFGSTATPWLAVEVYPEREDEKFLGPHALRNPSSPPPHPLRNADKDEIGRHPPDQSQQQQHDGGGAVGSSSEDRKGPPEAQKKAEDEHRWFVYSSDEVLDQLIGWLSPSSAQERSLKTTLLQWKGFLLIHRNAGNDGEQQLDGPLPGLVSPDLGAKGTTTTQHALAVPVLRATKLLERKYGPFGSSTPKSVGPPAPPKRGRKKKVQPMAELSRCSCLEPVWVSRLHCGLCHLTFDSATDLELHSKGGASCITGGQNSAEQQQQQEVGRKTGKKGSSQAGRGGGALSGKAAPEAPSGAVDPLSAIIALPPDAATMPFVVRDSNRDRVNRIGLIKDRGGPSFAPGLAVAPAFDPSLMILDPFGNFSLSAAEAAAADGDGGGAPSGGGQKLLDAVPIGGTSSISLGSADHLKEAQLALIKSDEDLPGVLDGAADANAAPLMMLHDPLGGARENAGEESHSLAILGNLLPGKGGKSGGRLFQVTGKQLVISEASLLPLQDKDVDLLDQLKMHLLDIEAVMPSDMLELGRASSSRRQAWRSLVKSAKSIYRVSLLALHERTAKLPAAEILSGLID